MREIKFRAWEYRRKWVKGKGYIDEFEWRMNYNPEIESSEVFGGGAVAFVNDIKDDDRTKWMLYTGLKDKNGKEIYEGDIVKGKDVLGEVSFGEYHQIGSSVRATGFHVSTCYGLTSEDVKDFEVEVVGNVFKNPELLKVQENQ